MLSVFDGLRDISLLSIVLRMIGASVCGGIIGAERELKRRPAGFRTHILICLGAAMTTLTSQYLSIILHYEADLSRMGAQVIAGIGFIGAGTIITTRHQRIKGLTTAAGLWSCAIIGLAIGSGFYEGGILATVLILAAELFFSKLKYRALNNTTEVNLLLEHTDPACVENVLNIYRGYGVKVLNMEVTRLSEEQGSNTYSLFNLQIRKHVVLEQVLQGVSAVEGVLSVEAL